MQVFLVQIIDFPKASLGPEETRHCIKVLRHQIGNVIYGTEGKGVMYRLRIIQTDLKQTELEVVESLPEYGEHPGRITLAVSPLRLKDRFEWLIEKAVELGVNEIQPLQCERTDLYKSKFKPARIQSIIETALKQCKRSRFPMLQPKTDFDKWIQQDITGDKFMGWCETDKMIQAHRETIEQSKQITLLIGPEGDFTEKEITQAQEQGFLPISLGENRLRTETACIFILGLVKGYWMY